MKEVWKSISDFPNYSVSSLGRVKRTVPARLPHGGFQPLRVLKSQLTRRGYLYVLLSARPEKPRRRFIPIHRLVLAAFSRPAKRQEEANHLNGIKTNNRIDNLEWTTRIGNAAHAINLGLYYDQRGKNHWTVKHPEKIRRGEHNNAAKLSLAQVKIILSTQHRYGSQTKLAKCFGVTVGTINNIVRKCSWAHIV